MEVRLSIFQKLKNKMMLKKLIYLLIAISFVNCDLSGFSGPGGEEGVGLKFHNYTDTEYTSYKFYVGAVKENNFIATDSIDINTTIYSINTAPEENIYSDPSTGVKRAVSEDGLKKSNGFPDGTWNIDYGKVREISEEYTFKLKLPDGREKIFIEDKMVFKNEFIIGLSGTLRISIKQNIIEFKD